MLSLLAGLVLAQAPAAPAPAETVYEDRLVEWALRTTGRELEPAPNGRRIEEILFAAENVFAPSDPIPTELNVFHVRTRETILAHEVLLAPGDTWDPALIEESERNLRKQYIIAVARVVAVKGTAGGVGLLVVTKDRWSLRLNSEFTLIGSLLQYLRLRPTEMNFLGRNQYLALDFTMRLDTISLGQSFIDRRLFGRELYFGEEAALIFSRRSGAVEGSTGTASFGRPLYSLQQTWAALLSGVWNVKRKRLFRGAREWQLDLPSGGTVPYEYDVREGDVELSGTRSFGAKWKTQLTGALGWYAHQYTPTPEVGADSEGGQYLVAHALPRTESATYATAALLFFKADYRVLHDLESYQLSEDWQVGPRLYAAVRAAMPTFLAPSQFVEAAAAARYRFLAKDNLLSLAVAGSTRFRPGDTLANQRLVFELREFSPKFEGGRVAWRLLVDLMRNDLDHRVLFLGGSNGLRGTLPEAFSGRNVIVSNLEWRLRPFEILSQWLALVAFYDVGAAYDVMPQLTHTLGFGLRLLLPHFNNEVIRVDLGFVVGGEHPSLERINASYGNVTELRPGFLDFPL